MKSIITPNVVHRPRVWLFLLPFVTEISSINNQFSPCFGIDRSICGYLKVHFQCDMKVSSAVISLRCLPYSVQRSKRQRFTHVSFGKYAGKWWTLHVLLITDASYEIYRCDKRDGCHFDPKNFRGHIRRDSWNLGYRTNKRDVTLIRITRVHRIAYETFQIVLELSWFIYTFAGRQGSMQLLLWPM